MESSIVRLGQEDKSAVRALYKGLLQTWNDQNARGMADLFAEDGSVVGYDGSQVDGREAIFSHLAPIFADHPTSTYVAIVREVRSLGPDAALLRAMAGMVPRGGSDINPAVNAVQNMVAVKSGGTWHVALFQNTPAAFHGRPEASATLTEELRQVLRGSD